MNVAKIVSNLRGDELKLIVMEQTVLAPKLHALKLFRTYNGGLRGHPRGLPGPFDPGELGVEEVSRLSGSRELARMYMGTSPASKQIPHQNLTPIALNPDMFPINKDTTGVPHMKADMVMDLFSVSSNGKGPFFRGERFSGGVASYHEIIKDMHRGCIGLPNYDLAARNYGCQDCNRNYLVQPEAFLDDKLEFCLECIGLWFARLRKLEQVYVIVPGLPKAQKTDTHHIIRYGAGPAVKQVNMETRESGPAFRFWGASVYRVNTRRVEGDVIVSHTTECFGSKGPCSFEGDGITLYEVAASDVPPHAARFIHEMAVLYTAVRVQWTNVTMGTSPPPLPENPKICGGMVEFKFLSYSQDP